MMVLYLSTHIEELNTPGFQPSTNGKNERSNGVLGKGIFKANISKDPDRWLE